MKRKTPQEKKALSYAKDRRSVHGNSDKAARKLVPRRKREPNRAGRRATRQALHPAVGEAAELPVDQLEDGIVARRKPWWRKLPDEPLGAVVERRLVKRMRRGQLSEEHVIEKMERVRRLYTGRGFLFRI